MPLPRRLLYAEADFGAFVNVLTSPRDCAVLDAHAAAIATLRNDASPPQARVAALSEVAAAVAAAQDLGIEFATPLLETESHIELVRQLTTHASALAATDFKWINGRPCRTLIGTRGIGKTNVVKAFTYGGQAAYPNVIFMYITGQDLGDQSCFQKLNLRQLMIATARAHGVHVDESKGAHALTIALSKAGKRMFIVVDEIDQLYRVGSDQPALRTNIQNTLHHLSTLGDQISGCYSVLLCGSSAATYKLICGDVTGFLADKFPLLKSGVPNLNSTKFEELLIPSVPCNDSKQVLGVINTLRMWPDATERERFRMARIITFLGGTTPRAVSSAIDVKANSAVSAQRMQELVNKQLRGTRVLSTADQHASSTLFSTVLRLLQEANRDLIGRLRVDANSYRLEELTRESDADVLLGPDAASGAAMAPAATAPADAAALAALPWEQLVRPVSYADVQSAWQEIAKTERRPTDSAYLDTLLGGLSDASLVSVRQDPGASGLRVWPNSAAQLVYGHTNTVAVELMESVVPALQPAVRFFRDTGSVFKPFG